MANGRPLRFLGGVLVSWTGVRVAMLWPAAIPLPALDAAPVAAAEPRASTAPPRSAIVRNVPRVSRLADRRPLTGPPPARRSKGPAAITPSTNAEVATAPARRDTPLQLIVRDGGQIVTPPIVAPPAEASRLRIDSWVVARPGGGANLAFGQLGGSQAGARLTYALDRDRRVALSARVSAPLRGAGSEMGLGIDIRPTRLPLHLLVEQRIDLDGGAARPAVIAVAGGSVALPRRARVDAYAQGGAVRARGGFIDAAAVITRPLAARGDTHVDVGGGAWGAAQRRVARLDVGPSIALVTPGAGGMLRLQLDYRARVAGRARPGSGPALILGGSF